MAANTGAIIAISVLGVAAIGVTIYLVTKKPAANTTTTSGVNSYGTSMPYYTQQRPATNTGIIPQQQQNANSWWQQPLGQAGGALLTNVINSVFSKNTTTQTNTNSGGGIAMNTSYNSNSGYNASNSSYSGYYSV